MAEAKHTPGPWKLTEGDELIYINARVDGQRIFILQRKKSKVAASTAYKEVEQDRIYADCCLIAASPDLLEVLQEILSDGMHCDVVPHLHSKARAAIAKALGVA